MAYDLLHGESQSHLYEGGSFASYDEALEAAGRLEPMPQWVEIDEVLTPSSRRPVTAWRGGVMAEPITYLGNPPEKERRLPTAGPRSRPSALAECAGATVSG